MMQTKNYFIVALMCLFAACMDVPPSKNVSDVFAKLVEDNTIDTAAQIKELLKNMVLIEGGIFEMGCDGKYSDMCNSDEHPKHKVQLSNFKIGKYEVTQHQWRAVMNTKPAYFQNCKQCPIERVNWADAQKFIEKLNKKTKQKFRLPTEAEWEYAARGGKKSGNYKYAGSNNLDTVAWYVKNSGNTLHKIGEKMPNELGLYDMTGNVWEWCFDKFDEDYYHHSTLHNPEGPDRGAYRVVRGGSWSAPSHNSRITNRYANNPQQGTNLVGFRLAQ
jgi:formylglycine-generating enzyme required for sulfatase activity